ADADDPPDDERDGALAAEGDHQATDGQDHDADGDSDRAGHEVLHGADDVHDAVEVIYLGESGVTQRGHRQGGNTNADALRLVTLLWAGVTHCRPPNEKRYTGLVRPVTRSLYQRPSKKCGFLFYFRPLYCENEPGTNARAAGAHRRNPRLQPTNRGLRSQLRRRLPARRRHGP